MAQITKDFQKLHLPYISFAIAAGGVVQRFPPGLKHL
jgi:hypothetical protein